MLSTIIGSRFAVIGTACKRVYRSRSGLASHDRIHDLRHTAYSKLDEAEVPEQVIMGLMGHVSRAMRERYSHARLDAMREAVKHLELDKPAKESAKVEFSTTDGKPLTH
jgi:integrase